MIHDHNPIHSSRVLKESSEYAEVGPSRAPKAESTILLPRAYIGYSATGYQQLAFAVFKSFRRAKCSILTADSQDVVKRIYPTFGDRAQHLAIDAGNSSRLGPGPKTQVGRDDR